MEPRDHARESSQAPPAPEIRSSPIPPGPSSSTTATFQATAPVIAPLPQPPRPPHPPIPFYQLDPPQTVVSFVDNPHTIPGSSFNLPNSFDQNPAGPAPAQHPSIGPSPLSTVSSHNPPSAPRLDVAEYLDPPLPALHGHSSAQGPVEASLSSEQQSSSSSDNPSEPFRSKGGYADHKVNLGFISRVEAENLVRLYHQHLNPILAHLDPACGSSRFGIGSRLTVSAYVRLHQ